MSEIFQTCVTVDHSTCEWEADNRRVNELRWTNNVFNLFDRCNLNNAIYGMPKLRNAVVQCKTEITGCNIFPFLRWFAHCQQSRAAPDGIIASPRYIIFPWYMPSIYIYVAFNDTAHPSCAYGHLSTRVNGVELRQRNNSFVRITSTGVRYIPGPTFNNFISTRRLSRPFDRARFGHVKSHERAPNSWQRLSGSILIHPRWRTLVLAGRKLCPCLQFHSLEHSNLFGNNGYRETEL